MRDVQIVPLNKEEELIISVDNSGGVGEKEEDSVFVPYEIVSYFSFRVAVMECIAAGGMPFSVILQNFCGDEAWNQLVSGIEKGIQELDLGVEIGITGSTESNFSLEQSAVGITILGKRQIMLKDQPIMNGKIAVIGSPLVGEEVILQAEQVVPLSVFLYMAQQNKYRLQPVGSKGIFYELGELKGTGFQEEDVDCSLNLLKSSGPSTCYLVEYEKEAEKELKRLTKGYFHEVLFLYNKSTKQK